MSKSKTLKEIALELLEKYRILEEVGIYHSESFKEDLAIIKAEYDEIRRQIEESLESKWTPVSKRLPDAYTNVLVSDGKHIWIDSLEDDFDKDGEYVVWWESFDFGDPVDFHKTAWMPLPELYKEGC